MGLYQVWVLGLRQNLEQVLWCQEEEASKDKSFCFQVIFKTSIDSIKVGIACLELMHDTFLFGKV